MKMRELIDAMDGAEIWTNVFGERRCVGIDKKNVVADGKVIAKLTKRVLVMALWDDLCEQSGVNYEMQMLKEEFGK